MALPVDTAKFRYQENGKRIRRARQLVPSPAAGNGRKAWISQEDFAPLIGTGRRHLIKLENGEHRPSGELRDRIVEVTGTKEQIESSDDDEEDHVFPPSFLRWVEERMKPLELSAFDLHETVDARLARHYRRSAMHSLARLVEIEKALA